MPEHSEVRLLVKVTIGERGLKVSEAQSMRGDTLDELKARVVASMDITMFLDMLGFDLVDVIDLFDDELQENFEAFDRACR